MPERPQLVGDIVVRSDGSRYLLLSPERGVWCVVDELGYRLARRCDGRRHWLHLAREVASEYHVEPRQVEEDVWAYFQQLAQAGLLAGTPAPSPPAETPGTTRLEQVTIHVTTTCNLRCRYCYQSPCAGGVDPVTPSLPVLQEWIDQAVAAGASQLTLTGGEVLTHPDWQEIVHYAAARIPTTVMTNAVLIDEAAAKALAAAGVKVQIGLDGSRVEVHEALRGRGTFAATMAGIRRLLDRGMGPRLIWSVCVTQHNLVEVAPILALALELGVALVYLLRVSRRGTAARNWRQLAVSAGQYAALVRQLQPWFRAYPGRFRLAECEGALALTAPGAGETPCPLGRVAMIDADGGIYPCSLLTGPEHRLGQASREGLAGALQAPRLERLRTQVAARMERVEDCLTCVWRRFCRGACPGLAWVQTGDWWATDDLCALRDELYTQTIFSWAMAEGGAQCSG